MRNGIFIVIGLIFVTDLIDTVAQLLLKSGINLLDMQINTIRAAWLFIRRLLNVPRVWLSFSLSALSLLVWLYVLSRNDLNLSFSLDSMRYILIAFASALFLKERITPLRWAGIVCVVVGISLVASG